jgi:DNA-binding NarL/FixJ family response regulator
VGSLVHLSSPIAAESVSSDAASTSLKAPSAPRSNKALSQKDNNSFIPVIGEICPSAEIDLEPSDIQSSRRGQGAKNSGDDRALTRNGSEPDIQYGPPDTDVVGLTEKKGGARQKPAIVVIHRRAVFRDCFVRCLEVSYRDRNIYSFANVADWFGSEECGAVAGAVVIMVVESGDEASLADLDMLESVTEKMPVIIVSDIDDVDHIVRTLKRGVRGYIPSDLPFNIAVEAVRLVEAGGVFVPASSFVDREQSSTPAKSAGLLTNRQMEVLEEIRHGKANKQIAYELNMSEHTVKVHLRDIMRKLKARNRTEVAVLSEALLASPKN